MVFKEQLRIGGYPLIWWWKKVSYSTHTCFIQKYPTAKFTIRRQNFQPTVMGVEHLWSICWVAYLLSPKQRAIPYSESLLKWLKICFTVPSSWSILNKKNRTCKSDPHKKGKSRIESHKSRYWGIALLFKLELISKGKNMRRCTHHNNQPQYQPEGCPQSYCNCFHLMCCVEKVPGTSNKKE